MISEKINKYKIEDLTQPQGGVFQIFIDHYWVVDNEDNVLKYLDRTWQCNSNYEIAKKFQEQVYPDCTIRQIPIMYTPWVY